MSSRTRDSQTQHYAVGDHMSKNGTVSRSEARQSKVIWEPTWLDVWLCVHWGSVTHSGWWMVNATEQFRPTVRVVREMTLSGCLKNCKVSSIRSTVRELIKYSINATHIPAQVRHCPVTYGHILYNWNPRSTWLKREQYKWGTCTFRFGSPLVWLSPNLQNWPLALPIIANLVRRIEKYRPKHFNTYMYCNSHIPVIYTVMQQPK